MLKKTVIFIFMAINILVYSRVFAWDVPPVEGVPVGICFDASGREIPCGGGGGGGSREVYRLEKSPEETEQERKWNVMADLNREGNYCYKNGDYETAIKYYLQALELVVNQPEVLINLENAKKWVVYLEYKRKEEVQADIERERQHREGEVANSLRQGIGRLCKMLRSADFNGVKTAGESLTFLDSSVVDLRDARTLAVDPTKVRGALTDKPAVTSQTTRKPAKVIVPSPTGALTPQQRKQRQEIMTQLSDADLNTKINQAKSALQKMRGDFLNDSQLIEEWAAEAQEAEAEALRESFKLLAGAALKFRAGMVKARNFDSQTLQRIQWLSEMGLKALDWGEPLQGLAKDLKDHQSNLELAQVYIEELHGILEKHQDAFFDSTKIPERTEGFMKGAGVTDATILAGFLVNYTYEASRWAVAYNQINALINNLDNPKGKLKAQQVMKLYYEDLIQERKRRRI